MDERVVNILKIIAFAEFLSGLILLSKEIIDYIHLPTVQEIDNHFGVLVEWYKYKESCYKNLFLYLLITVTGFSFWLNKKLYWGLTQILLITLLFIAIFTLFFLLFFHWLLKIIIVSLLILIFLYLEIKLCNSGLLKTMGISKTMEYWCFFAGLSACIIWFILL